MTSLRVHTYHCNFCSHLLLASTHIFSNLPTRKAPGLDHAIIVPLPPPPKTESSEDSESSSSSDSSDSEPEPEPESSESSAPNPTDFDPQKTSLVEDSEATKGSAGGLPPPKRPSRKQKDKNAYTLLLFLLPERASKIITREDGFEKRRLWRCGRCRLLVGYQLDDVHYSIGPKGNTRANTLRATGVMGGEAGADKDRSEKERRRMERKKKRFLYVLPGAVVPTEELGEGGEEKVVDIVPGEA